MSDTTGNAQPQTQGGITGRQLLQAVRENFVLVSGAAIILGVGMATLFLAAYLSVFDWHLLWFVQYTDILTFGIIAVGVVSGSFIFVGSSIQSILNLFKLNAKSKRTAIIVICFIVSAILGLQVWASIRAGQGYLHIAFGALVAGLSIIVFLRVVGHIRVKAIPNLSQIMFFVVFVVMTVFYGGQWLGYSVLETNKLMDIKITDSMVTGARIVIVMSRHTIFLKDREIYIVPTADIQQFHRTAGPSEFE
jgi:hypothetical protein